MGRFRANRAHSPEHAIYAKTARLIEYPQGVVMIQPPARLQSPVMNRDTWQESLPILLTIDDDKCFHD